MHIFEHTAYIFTGGDGVDNQNIFSFAHIFLFHYVLTVYWIIRLLNGLKCQNLVKLSLNQHHLGSYVLQYFYGFQQDLDLLRASSEMILENILQSHKNLPSYQTNCVSPGLLHVIGNWKIHSSRQTSLRTRTSNISQMLSSRRKAYSPCWRHHNQPSSGGSRVSQNKL